MREKPGWVYILVGRTGTLYTGVTSNLDRRILERRTKIHSGFAARYDCNRLVYYERLEHIVDAINREKRIKGWTRKKKMDLVRGVNPEWKDLAADMGKPMDGFENSSKVESF